MSDFERVVIKAKGGIVKTKMRPRYYCDHCNKGSGSPSYMRRHEKGCTANPDRDCGMCRVLYESEGIEKAPGRTVLIEILDNEGFNAMHEAANGCPACILSVLRTKNRKANHESPPGINGPEDGRELWSYAKEKEAWWKEFNYSQQPDY